MQTLLREHVDDFKILIPSRGRLTRQFTWDTFNEFLRSKAAIVCPPEEVEEHIKRGRNAIARPVSGIANVRQWITESHPNQVVIMLDDDLKFFKRELPHRENLQRVWRNEVERVLAITAAPVLSGAVPYAGLSPRQMNQRHFPYVYQHNTKINAVHVYRPSVLLENNIKFNDVNLMEDYHVILSLLKKGFGNMVYVAGAWDQKMPSGSAGGVSDFRTLEVQAEGARRLAELHPEVVKVVTKVPKVGWSDGNGGIVKERTDVEVSWKKAYTGEPTPAYI